MDKMTWYIPMSAFLGMMLWMFSEELSSRTGHLFGTSLMTSPSPSWLVKLFGIAIVAASAALLGHEIWSTQFKFEWIVSAGVSFLICLSVIMVRRKI